LAAILGGIGYLLSYLVKEYGLLSRNSAVLGFFTFAFIVIQYIPAGKSALFWYAVIVNYILPFGLLLVAIVHADKFLHGRGYRYLVFLSLIALYISGAGYMTVILTFEVLVLYIVYALWNKNRRGFFLLLPLALWLIGALISVLAPGNEVRGGGEFDYSLVNVVLCIGQSIVQGAFNIPKYFMYARLLFIYYPLLVWLAWEYLDVDICKLTFRCPLGVGALMFLVYCSSYAPEIFASSATSSGVTNSYWLIFMVLSSFTVIYFSGYIKRRRLSGVNSCLKLYRLACVGMVAASLLLSRHFIGNMFDYEIYQYILSGQLNDYRAQMKERLELLNDPEVSDVVVPMMNPYQGPYMHFALIEDSSAYTNYATAAFYGKNTVTAIPRDEFDAMMNSGE